VRWGRRRRGGEPGVGGEVGVRQAAGRSGEGMGRRTRLAAPAQSRGGSREGGGWQQQSGVQQPRRQGAVVAAGPLPLRSTA
jgi:hypothetical protein